jgi:hypothetical protein
MAVFSGDAETELKDSVVNLIDRALFIAVSVLLSQYLLAGRRKGCEPVGRVVAVISGDPSCERFAVAIRCGRPEVKLAGNIFRMGAVAVIDPVDADIMTLAILVNVTGHTKLQLLAGIAQLAVIRAENLLSRHDRIPPGKHITVLDQ